MSRASRPQRRRRVVARLGAWTAVFLVCLVVGVGNARANYAFGPHEATYDVVYQPEVTVDLGPLGSLVVPDPLGAWPIGVTVTVGEIPADFTALDASQTLTALAGDLSGYTAFFGHPAETIAVVARRLVESAGLGTALLFGGALALWFGGRWLLGAARRAELRQGLRRRRIPIGVAVVVLLSGSVLVADRPAEETESESVAAFAGTPLAGARVTGRLGWLLDVYGGQVMAVYQENEDFYNRAAANMAAAFELDVPPGKPVLMVTDLHCNLGMSRVVGAAAGAAGADLVVNAGDTTVSGTSVESYCVDTLADALPSGVHMVVADGNHDSNETSKQEASRGMTVLRGEIADVGGIRFLGDTDPTLTALGQETHLTGAETIEDESARLARVACDADDPPDVLLVHNPKGAFASLDAGCVPLALSGHLHSRVGPEDYGRGVRYVGSSTGRGIDEKTLIGPLSNNAEMTVFYFDGDNDAISYRLITITPDADVRLGQLLAMPRAAGGQQLSSGGAGVNRAV